MNTCLTSILGYYLSLSLTLTCAPGFEHLFLSPPPLPLFFSLNGTWNLHLDPESTRSLKGRRRWGRKRERENDEKVSVRKSTEGQQKRGERMQKMRKKRQLSSFFPPSFPFYLIFPSSFGFLSSDIFLLLLIPPLV